MRPSELCPECGSGHTMCLQSEVETTVYYRCVECRSGWHTTGEINKRLAESRNLILSLK